MRFYAGIHDSLEIKYAEPREAKPYHLASTRRNQPLGAVIAQ